MVTIATPISLGKNHGPENKPRHPTWEWQFAIDPFRVRRPPSSRKIPWSAKGITSPPKMKPKVPWVTIPPGSCHQQPKGAPQKVGFWVVFQRRFKKNTYPYNILKHFSQWFSRFSILPWGRKLKLAASLRKHVVWIDMAQQSPQKKSAYVWIDVYVVMWCIDICMYIQSFLSPIHCYYKQRVTVKSQLHLHSRHSLLGLSKLDPSTNKPHWRWKIAWENPRTSIATCWTQRSGMEAGWNARSDDEMKTSIVDCPSPNPQLPLECC